MKNKGDRIAGAIALSLAAALAVLFHWADEEKAEPPGLQERLVEGLPHFITVRPMMFEAEVVLPVQCEPGMDFRIEWSTDLKTWHDPHNLTMVSGDFFDTGRAETWLFAGPDDTGCLPIVERWIAQADPEQVTDRLFWRVRVIPIDPPEQGPDGRQLQRFVAPGSSSLEDAE